MARAQKQSLDDERKFGFLAKLPRERGLHHRFSAALSISIQAAMTLEWLVLFQKQSCHGLSKQTGFATTGS